MEQGDAFDKPKSNRTDNRITIKNYDAWSLSLYRKQKRLMIETLDYHAGPLIITRDELCDIARLMGLHVRKRKRKNTTGHIEQRVQTI